MKEIDLTGIVAEHIDAINTGDDPRSGRSLSYSVSQFRGRRGGVAGDPTVRADIVGESRLVRGVSLPQGESAH